MPDGSLADVDESMLSFNHYAYGAVAAWMYRTLAGISPTVEKPGYEEIIFAPKPSERIKWAKASVQTRFGFASIDWKEIENGEFEIKIIVPAGSTGWFISPKDESKTRLGSGSHFIKL
jgi:alpha-L-rhamnosidase